MTTNKNKDQFIQEIDILNAKISKLTKSLSEERLSTSKNKIFKEKQAEATLSKSELKFRQLIENNYTWVYWIDMKGNYIYISSSCKNVTGYSSNEFLSNPDLIFKIVKSDYVKKVQNHYQSEMDQLQPVFSMDYPIITKEGSELWLEHFCSPVYDEQGHFIGRQGINRDITARKNAEAEIKKLSTAVEYSANTIVIADTKANIEYVNPKFTKLTGYSTDEIIGKNPSILKSGEQSDKVYKKLWKTISSGNEWHGEFQNKKKNGKLFWEAASISPIFDDQGKITAYVKVAEDITKRKKVEVSLKESEEQLRAYSLYFDTKVEEEKKKIAREIHDGLGQLLTGLKMDLLWVKKKIPKDIAQLNNKLDAMKEMIDSGVNMVNDISMQLRPGMLDDLGLIATIEWKLEVFQIQTNIKYRTVFKPDEFIVGFDRSITLYRIFMEILTNIYRHSGASKMELSLIKKRDEIMLRIKDNGKGITYEETNSNLSFGIIGIKERVNIWKGNVKFEGIHGKGTVVTVNIPL